MSNEVLIAALHQVTVDKKLAEVLLQVIAVENDIENEMSLLMTIGNNDRTEEFYLSKEGDEEWEFQVEENDEDDRETFAKEEAEFWMHAGYPNSNFYTPPKKLPPNTWLAHFTDADPEKVIKEGFYGKDYEVLGLTGSSAESGPYAFAYKADNIQRTRGFGDEAFGKYGKNLILFKAKHAISTYHHGDEEEQVIFLNYSAYDLHPIWGDDDQLTVYDKDDEEVVCDRDEECINTLIDVIEGK